MLNADVFSARLASGHSGNISLGTLFLSEDCSLAAGFFCIAPSAALKTYKQCLNSFIFQEPLDAQYFFYTSLEYLFLASLDYNPVFLVRVFVLIFTSASDSVCPAKIQC